LTLQYNQGQQEKKGPGNAMGDDFKGRHGSQFFPVYGGQPPDQKSSAGVNYAQHRF